MPDTNQRLHAIFHGDVQGVGFRYTTRRLALAYHTVTGVVRNLSDGTVELIAEGPKTDLDSLLTDISDTMQRYVTHIDKEYRLASQAYQAFTIGF